MKVRMNLLYPEQLVVAVEVSFSKVSSERATRRNGMLI